MAYEVLPGDTSDKTTLRDFLDRIAKRYGKAERIWLMDRGVPTEEVLSTMRASDPPVKYLVGTPKGRLTKLEKELIGKPWQEERPGRSTTDGRKFMLTRYTEPGSELRLLLDKLNLQLPDQPPPSQRRSADLAGAS